MNEPAQLNDLLNKKEKLVAMLAPSFPIVYDYPQIVGKLKRLGFSYVIEVAAGAAKTNEQLLAALRNDPKSRFITSPCASFVRLVRTKYPNYLKYLAFQVDSPMIASAKIVKEKYPGFRPVFIGPCVAKKLESSEDHPDLNILVLTYKEMDQIFKQFKILDDPTDSNNTFDVFNQNTRVYPMDGGLTLSSGANRVLKDEEFMIVSGWKNCEAALKEFESNSKIRLLDILFCEGGCVNGPGVVSILSIVDRKKKIIDYFNKPI